MIAFLVDLLKMGSKLEKKLPNFYGTIFYHVYLRNQEDLKQNI